MIEKLEELKRKGCYNVNIYYGEGTGADDSDVKSEDRKLLVLFEPVGYLGEMRGMFRGTVKDFLLFDFSTSPKILTQPIQTKEYKQTGLYCWGTKSSIERFKTTGKLFPF